MKKIFGGFIYPILILGLFQGQASFAGDTDPVVRDSVYADACIVVTEEIAKSFFGPDVRRLPQEDEDERRRSCTYGKSPDDPVIIVSVNSGELETDKASLEELGYPFEPVEGLGYPAYYNETLGLWVAKRDMILSYSIAPNLTINPKQRAIDIAKATIERF